MPTFRQMERTVTRAGGGPEPQRDAPTPMRFGEVLVLELSSDEEEDEPPVGGGGDELVGDEAPVEGVNVNEEAVMQEWIRRKAVIATYVVRSSTTVLLFPFEFARTLMQVGYEPVQPIPSITLLRRPCLLLPNVFSYLKYIKSVDGILGCYRGLVPYLLSRGTNFAVYTACRRASKALIAVPGVPNSPYGSQKAIIERASGDYVASVAPGEQVHREGEFRTYLRDMSLDVAWNMVGITTSYPFRLVAIHAMASFVGREPALSKGAFGIIKAIWNNQGASGFFNGLAPRLLGEAVSALCVGFLTYGVKVRISGDFPRLVLRMTIDFLTNALTYPFSVVSSTMAINGGCSELGGSGLFGPAFSSWYECWNYLQGIGQHRRGSNIIWRYYTGPTVNHFGVMRPSPFVYFGPNLSKSYKY